MGSIHDYFSFSKRERTGVIVLVTLIVITFLLPDLLPPEKSALDKDAADRIQKQLAELKSRNDSIRGVSRTRSRENAGYYPSPQDFAETGPLFEFDPNTLEEEGWKKLGISNRTISTIKKYIAKGGRFTTPEDLGKIYGLRKDQFERLLPYVKIKGTAERMNKGNVSDRRPESFAKLAGKTSTRIDLNAADTALLIALPGIGSKLANRIINFRNKLGGFYSVDQVKEVYGLQDSTFQKIKGYLHCDSSQIQQININTADAGTLKNHPYIKWNIGNAIVNYRLQHGDYQSVQDLLRVDIISQEIFLKLIPYLKVN
jgi:competence ComEA-like helix-hairpin-helix protein